MRTRIIWLFRIILFLALVGSFLFFVPIQKIIDAIRGASPYFFWMSYLLGFPISYLSAIRLWILTQKQGIQATPLKLLEINLVIKFYSFFSPASAVGSFMRWYRLSGNGKSAEALTAVAVNRLFDIFVTTIFGMFWIFGETNSAILIQPGWILLFMVVVMFLWLALTHYSPPTLLWFQSRIETSELRWLKKTGYYLERFYSSLRVYSSLTIGTLLLIIFIGLVSELIGVLGYYYLALSIDVPVSLASLGWMRSLFLLISFIPFTLTGGIGLREVSIIWILTAVGIHADIAAAFSFLIYARSVFTGLTGGLIELVTLRKTHG